MHAGTSCACPCTSVFHILGALMAISYWYCTCLPSCAQRLFLVPGVWVTSMSASLGVCRFEWKIPEEAMGVLAVEPANGIIDPGEIQVSCAILMYIFSEEVGSVTCLIFK